MSTISNPCRRDGCYQFTWDGHLSALLYGKCTSSSQKKMIKIWFQQKPMVCSRTPYAPSCPSPELLEPMKQEEGETGPGMPHIRSRWVGTCSTCSSTEQCHGRETASHSEQEGDRMRPLHVHHKFVTHTCPHIFILRACLPEGV